MGVKPYYPLILGAVCMPQGYWLSLVEGGNTANALTNDLLADMGAVRHYRKLGFRW